MTDGTDEARSATGDGESPAGSEASPAGSGQSASRSQASGDRDGAPGAATTRQDDDVDILDRAGGLDGAVAKSTQPVSQLLSRIEQTRVARWLLFQGERSMVTLALLAAVFTAFIGLALVRPVDMARLLSETTTLRTLFAALLSGAILIVSVVSSISSIVLSQEITDIETEQERIDASIQFRRRAEDLADVEDSPGQPAAFLEVILYTIYQQAQELGTVATRSDNDEFADQVESFAEEVLSEAKDAASTLDGARFGTFKVLSAGLNYDYSWQLNTARRIQNRYGDELTDEESAVLAELIDTLKFFATGREYFQSLYYKREVARLSSTLLYVSLPVIVFISYLMLALDANIFPTLWVGPLSALSIFILFAYTVSLAPYVVLTAHVIRVAAITMQTLAAGPFIVRQRDHRDIVELNMDTDPDQWTAGLDADAIDGAVRTATDDAGTDGGASGDTSPEGAAGGDNTSGGTATGDVASGGAATGGATSDASTPPPDGGQPGDDADAVSGRSKAEGDRSDAEGDRSKVEDDRPDAEDDPSDPDEDRPDAEGDPSDPDEDRPDADGDRSDTDPTPGDRADTP